MAEKRKAGAKADRKGFDRWTSNGIGVTLLPQDKKGKTDKKKGK